MYVSSYRLCGETVMIASLPSWIASSEQMLPSFASQSSTEAAQCWIRTMLRRWKNCDSNLLFFLGCYLALQNCLLVQQTMENTIHLHRSPMKLFTHLQLSLELPICGFCLPLLPLPRLILTDSLSSIHSTLYFTCNRLRLCMGSSLT